MQSGQIQSAGGRRPFRLADAALSLLLVLLLLVVGLGGLVAALVTGRGYQPLPSYYAEQAQPR